MKQIKKPLVSIGIPVYNGGIYFEKALKCILNQTYTHLEIIISDNCSTDNTVTIAENYAKNDKRVKIFRQKNNIGELPNFNFILSKAQGELFSWHAADDFRDKTNIEELVNLLKAYPNAIGSMCDYNNVYHGKTYFVNKPLEYDNSVNHLQSLKDFIIRRNIISLFALYRTNILKSVGGHHQDSRPFFKGSDFLTILRVLIKGKMVYTSKVLLFKVDTGYFTNRYTIIQNKLFDKTIIKIVMRYLCSPIFYLYDLFYSFIFTFQSSLTLQEKMYIGLWSILNFFKLNIAFLFSVLKGMIIIFKKSINL